MQKVIWISFYTNVSYLTDVVDKNFFNLKNFDEKKTIFLKICFIYKVIKYC